MTIAQPPIVDLLLYFSSFLHKSLVYSTPLPPLKKLDGAEPISRPKTIKSILRSKSTFKAKALKGVIINKPTSAPAKGNNSSSASKVHSAPVGKLKSVKIKDDPPLAIVMKELNNLNYKLVRISHLTPECDIRKPIWYLDSGCSRYMTGVKSYLHKYVEQSGPKVVFGDDSTCTTEGYGSIKCNGIVFTKVAFVNGLKYQINSNDVSFIEPYEYPEPVILEIEVSSDQNGQTDQNDHNDQNDQSAQNDEILNDDHSKHSKHTNDEQIIDNLLNTKDIQISEHLSSPSVEDTSVQNTIPIPTSPLPIPSMVTPAPQDRCAASAHECLFVDFLSEEEPKKASKALKHPGWVDAMQDELNQFTKNKV
ncbi:hypothetical protein Tco_0692271 [Tanacetum coccineum]